MLSPTVDDRPTGDRTLLHESDFVLLSAGFRGDQDLLEMAEVELRGENRAPVCDPATMETNGWGRWRPQHSLACGSKVLYPFIIVDFRPAGRKSTIIKKKKEHSAEG